MEDMLLTQLQNAGYIINENYHDHHHKTQLSSLSSSSLDLNEVQPIVIQCFDENSLRYLHTKTTIIPLVQLLEHQSILFWTEGEKKTSSLLSSSSSSSLLSLSSSSSSSLTSLTLQQISTYAQAIGPTKEDFGDISYNQAIKYIQNIKKYNLFIHPWTFRADREIILKFNNDFDVEQMYFYCCLGEDDNNYEYDDVEHSCPLYYLFVILFTF
jgi:glycerophosphoryl diester phosphodiesterase